MGMTELRLILTACLVISVRRSVQLSSQTPHTVISGFTNDGTGVQENFRNLFDSVARSDMKRGEAFRDVLKSEIAKERQTFDSAKDEFVSLRNRKADSRENSFDRTHIGRNILAVKRETNDKNSITPYPIEKRCTQAGHVHGVSDDNSEMVYEYVHETTSANQMNMSRPYNETEQRIRATPEHKYRMTVILALQLYWGQVDYAILVERQYQNSFVGKGAEIPHLTDLLHDVNKTLKEKTPALEEIYVELYDEENITWTEKMTKMPIDQAVIDGLAGLWQKVEHTFEEHIRLHYKRPKELPADVPDYDVESMRGLIHTARDELTTQYEKIKTKMNKVLRILDERKMEILPDSATENEFDTLVEKEMGHKLPADEDITAEMERIVRDEDKLREAYDL